VITVTVPEIAARHSRLQRPFGGLIYAGMAHPTFRVFRSGRNYQLLLLESRGVKPRKGNTDNSQTTYFTPTNF
jgi:hypothetical protein